ncbi:MAG: hypothetical protein FWH46_00805 [Methanimicrococcus sp.]|nr:hypothetical protein [Methanimicrococcus sp.]
MNTKSKILKFLCILFVLCLITPCAFSISDAVADHPSFFTGKVMGEYLDNYGENVSMITADFAPIIKITRADLVVRGTVKEVTPGSWYTADGQPLEETSFNSFMYHDIIVEVDEVYKGKTDGQTITVRLIGGVADDHVLIHLDSFNYRENDQVILYLTKFDSKENASHYSAILGGEFLVIGDGLIFKPNGEEAALSNTYLSVLKYSNMLIQWFLSPFRI